MRHSLIGATIAVAAALVAIACAAAFTTLGTAIGAKLNTLAATISA